MSVDINNLTVSEIIEVATIPSAKGREANIKNRFAYGLSFCIEGQITYTQNGIKYVSDKNHAVILPQGQSYSLYGDKKGVFTLINFRCRRVLCDTICVLPIHSAEEYIKDFENMRRLSLFEGTRPKMFSIFYNMLYRLSTQTSYEKNLLFPAIKHLEQNYCDPTLTNSTLASLCGISEVYFRSLFLKEYHITPRQYIINVRLDKAKQLLSEGGLKISAISELCGFSNQYHFCRIFKDKEGKTPSEYMRENHVFKL